MISTTHLTKDSKLLPGYTFPLGSAPHAIVAPLHQPPLQLDRVPDEPVALEPGAPPSSAPGLDLEPLEHGVEAGVVALGQQQQQVQARHLAALAVARGREARRRPLVKGPQLLEVAREGVRVLPADGEQGARFEGGAGEVQELGRGVRGREEGVEGEELAFGGREEGGDLLGRGGRGGLQLGEGGVELGDGHCGWRRVRL